MFSSNLRIYVCTLILPLTHLKRIGLPSSKGTRTTNRSIAFAHSSFFHSFPLTPPQNPPAPSNPAALAPSSSPVSLPTGPPNPSTSTVRPEGTPGSPVRTQRTHSVVLAPSSCRNPLLK